MWVGLGQSKFDVEGVMLVSVKLEDFGESGGVAYGPPRNTDDGRLVKPPSARGEGFRGA